MLRHRSRRLVRPITGGRAALALIVIVSACSSGERAADTAAVPADWPGAGATDTASSAWTGRYALRGTIEGNRQAAGALVVVLLEPGSAAHDSTRNRVRRTYPSYDGPLYRGELMLAAGDSLRSTFTCANSPSTPPSLVCHPSVPIPAVRDASLVVQPDGRASLSGSHGEGVTEEYGKFRWERAANE